MGGITLITGVNYSGKGLVMQSLQSMWTQRVNAYASFITASAHMRALGKLAGYADLAAMPRDQRNLLRLASFQVIAEMSQRNPVFLDTHFVFEDGERVDFTPLIDTTRQILVVHCDPEVIYFRAVDDRSGGDHPGRLLLKRNGIAFITRYQEDDRQAAEQFAGLVSERTGYSMGFHIVENSAQGDAALRSQLESLLPVLQYGHSEGPKFPVEGGPGLLGKER